MPRKTPAPGNRSRKSQLRDSNPRRSRVGSEPGTRGMVNETEVPALGLIDQRQVGVINLDGDGTIVELNGRGSAILEEGTALRADERRIRAQRREDEEALSGLLESVRAGEPVPGRGGETSVGCWTDSRPLTVYALRGNGCRSDVAAVMLLVDPWRETLLRWERVARSLRLTPAESQVAVALAEGRTVEEIARATGKTRNTIRRLVQDARERTHCPRQADLVRLVFASSYLPIAQWD